MVRILGRTLTRRELAERMGSASQVFGVDLVTSSDGAERGNRILRFRSGARLEFDVMVDRAMDLAGLTYRGVPIGWHSAPGFPSPWLSDVEDENGFGWFRSMSGLMNSCGLDHIHGPETDSGSHFHHPPRPEISYGLHGRIALTPARLTGYGTRWTGDEAILYATGEIRQATVFGENLVLERTIEVDVGGKTIRYRDTVRNDGFDKTPHAYLWHINMGWPLVDEGSRIKARVGEPLWWLRPPQDTENGPLQQIAPQMRTTQQVWEHDLKPDPDKWARAAMINAAFDVSGGTGLALEVGFDTTSMPALFEWQNFQSGMYVVALEPTTTHAGTRKDWLDRGEFHMLGHGDEVHYALDLTPHLGASDITDLETRLSGD